MQLIQLIPKGIRILLIHRIAVGTAGQYAWSFDRRHVPVGYCRKLYSITGGGGGESRAQLYLLA